MDRSIKPRTTVTEDMWSSLLSGPLVEIGACMLATGDVDHYLGMRAVLRSWRAAMDDPKKLPADPRFHLRQWVMLDEEHPRYGGRLFLNTTTGRFLHINLSGLATKYYFVISTGGLLVLATRSPPHTVCVVNPLTASCINFSAAMPDSLLHTIAHLRLGGTTPTLVLEHPAGDIAYSATPDDEDFVVVNYSLLDKAHSIWGITDEVVDNLLTSIINDRSWEKYPCWYFLQSAGERLLVLGRKHPGRGMEVFKVNIEQKVIEPKSSIGSHALFLGDRCVTVNVDNIPSIDGNCVFYRGRDQHDARYGIYKYDLTTEKEELITWDVAEILGLTGKPAPSSIIQLLVNYCTNIPWSQLENERLYGHQQELRMEE